MLKRLVHAVLVAAALALPVAASAQSYPTKPVRILVTLGPGSSSDILARLVADELSKRLGQNFIVENRPGAGGNIAADVAAKSPNDGYTLLMSTISTHGINPSLYASIPFDPVKDFAPIGLLASNPNVLIVNPALPVNNLKELLALAAQKPGELTYSSGGAGTSQHLGGELMGSMAKVKLTHVPYKSTPESLNAVVGGQVSMSFTSVPVAAAQVKAGKVKALGISSEKPLAMWPEMPTIASQGLPGFNVSAWFGMSAPAGTPQPIIDKLNAELNAIMTSPGMREKLAAQGMEVTTTTPAEYGKFIQSEIERWRPIVKASGATAN
jgi:tripartite-type tricarboxylate transporter receptor subunit TctC